jgi:DNA-binding protein HU-beta
MIVHSVFIPPLLTMNKSELIEAAAEITGSTKKDTDAILTAVLKAISTALAAGDEVTLVGFGTFSVGERQARTGRNPRTGEPIDIPAKRVPSFSAGKGLKQSVEG